MILAYAGNRIDNPRRPEPRFPAASVDRVAQQVANFLAQHQPERLVGAAAGGADLIILEQAAHTSIPTQIVLPLKVQQFKQRSVEDHGPAWSARFEQAMEQADKVTIHDLAHHHDWYLRGNDLILTTATQQATNKPVTALIIAPALDTQSASADFRRKAIAHHFTICSIEPG